MNPLAASMSADSLSVEIQARTPPIWAAENKAGIVQGRNAPSGAGVESRILRAHAQGGVNWNDIHHTGLSTPQRVTRSVGRRRAIRQPKASKPRLKKDGGNE